MGTILIELDVKQVLVLWHAVEAILHDLHNPKFQQHLGEKHPDLHPGTSDEVAKLAMTLLGVFEDAFNALKPSHSEVSLKSKAVQN